MTAQFAMNLVSAVTLTVIAITVAGGMIGVLEFMRRWLGDKSTLAAVTAVMIILSFLLVSCGGGGSAPAPLPPEPPAPPPPPVLDCSATLSWTAPTERIDGTPLGLDELSKLTLYGTRDGSLDLMIDIVDVALISWEIRTSPEGNWMFEMTATDTLDQESDRSNQAHKIIPQGC